MRALLPWFLLPALLAAPARRPHLQIPVWVESSDEDPAEPSFSARLDGKAAEIVGVRAPDSGLLVLVVFDISEEIDLGEIAKQALLGEVAKLPDSTYVGLLRAQDGLRVLLDPVPDHDAIGKSIASLPVAGKAGLLDTLESACRVGDAVLSKTPVRVAVLYLSDSRLGNYREDFTNPVINYSDGNDMSRRFPEGLIKDKISKLKAKIAAYETPLFIVHLVYRTERLEEAYQSGLMELANETGGGSTFCRTRTEIAPAISNALRLIRSHYSLTLELPAHPARQMQLQLENKGHTLSYRSRLAIQEK